MKRLEAIRIIQDKQEMREFSKAMDMLTFYVASIVGLFLTVSVLVTS